MQGKLYYFDSKSGKRFNTEWTIDEGKDVNAESLLSLVRIVTEIVKAGDEPALEISGPTSEAGEYVFTLIAEYRKVHHDC